jgi:hypothetical protein
MTKNNNQQGIFLYVPSQSQDKNYDSDHRKIFHTSSTTLLSTLVNGMGIYSTVRYILYLRAMAFSTPYGERLLWAEAQLKAKNGLTKETEQQYIILLQYP